MKKSNLMIFVILSLWGFLIWYFDVWLLSFINFQSNVWAKASIIGFVVCIDLFWLYSIYHLVVSIFSKLFSKTNIKRPPLLSPPPRVAILYLTMNDFKEEALASCLNQDYENFKVFCLDDSTDNSVRDEIDNSVISYLPEKTEIIRRPTREGYKAGNLNYGLAKISQQSYEYFTVCDADSILPKDFLKKAIPYFSLDESIGFVQANQRINPKQISNFVKNFYFLTELHWKYYVPARNKYGFLMFYGRGAVVRTNLWKKIGGFPQSLTEDIAFSSLLRERGYKGIFAKDIICYEDFPRDYGRFRKRNERWIKGTTEYLFKWYPALFFDKKVSLAEKIDLLLASGNLLLATPFLLYLLIVGILLPFTLVRFEMHIPLFLKIVPALHFYTAWNWPFYLAIIFACFGQMMPIIMEFIKKPLKLFKFIANYTLICLSMLLVSTWNFLSFFITKKKYFAVSGERKVYEQNYKLISLTEISLALCLMGLFFYTSNIWLITVAMGLSLSFLLYKPVQNKWSMVISFIPFSLNLLILVLIGLFL